MDGNELKRLKNLREVYLKSVNICDPIEYAFRQQKLLQAIAKHLIDPLYEYEKEFNEK